MDSVQELAEKLSAHKEQLSQIEELLKQTPTDAELLKLKDDLTQVIALTQELQQPLIPYAVVPQDSKWRPKDRCSAMWNDGKYYPAEVLGGANDEYEVKYLEFGNVATVPESSIQTFVPAPKDQLKKGAPIKAISEEGLFFDAVFMEKAETAGNFMVRFPALGKKLFEVSGYDILMRAGKFVKDPDGPLPDKPVIPDHIKIKKTDSEQTKISKKRKIKRIKSNHRRQKMEEEGKKTQSNWLSFMNGSRAVKKHKSIFSSTENGVVGVMGSGKAMTHNKERTKHQFREDEEEDDDDDEDEQ